MPLIQVSVKGGYVLSHAQELGSTVGRHFHLMKNNTVTSTACSKTPRVAVLNRRKQVGRSILNADVVAQELEKHGFPNVSVMYFEGRTFQEQIQFYANVDILVSPHGAQLTGLPFMAMPSSSSDESPKQLCKSVLELFPKGYAIPDFFGSLAVNSGLSYAYLYMSDGDIHSERANTFLDRIQARATNLCPSPLTIVNSMLPLHKEWESCCANN